MGCGEEKELTFITWPLGLGHKAIRALQILMLNQLRPTIPDDVGIQRREIIPRNNKVTFSRCQAG